MKKGIALLLLALLPMLLFAQRYEGEKDKKGRPQGQGKMYFEYRESYYIETFTYTEILEGTFEKGIPVRGKSYRYCRKYSHGLGALVMEFEGEFKPKGKRIGRLSDLYAYGNITIYSYFDHMTKDFHVVWGRYDVDKVAEGFYMSYDKKRVARVSNGNLVGNWEPIRTPEEKKRLDKLTLDYHYYKKFCSMDALPIGSLKPAKATVFTSFCRELGEYNVIWSGNIVDGLVDGQGFGIAFKDENNIEPATLSYFSGTFKRGEPVPGKYSCQGFVGNANKYLTWSGKIKDLGKKHLYYFFDFPGTTSSYYDWAGIIFRNKAQKLVSFWYSYPPGNPKTTNHEFKNYTLLDDGSTLVDMEIGRLIPLSNDISTFPFKLQYKIDKTGHNITLMPSASDNFMFHANKIAIYKKALMAPLNVRDLNAFPGCLKRYGIDYDNMKKRIDTYEFLCETILPQLNQECKDKAAAIKKDEKDRKDLFELLGDMLLKTSNSIEYIRQYRNLDALRDFERSFDYCYPLQLKHVDEMVKRSLIREDAAQLAKKIIGRQYETMMAAVNETKSRLGGGGSSSGTDVIDWQRCREPSGKLEDVSMLSSYKQYANSGFVYFKNNSTSVMYNIVYKPNGNFDHYQIQASQLPINKFSFQKKDDMFNEIVRAYRQKYR